MLASQDGIGGKTLPLRLERGDRNDTVEVAVNAILASADDRGWLGTGRNGRWPGSAAPLFARPEASATDRTKCAKG